MKKQVTRFMQIALMLFVFQMMLPQLMAQPIPTSSGTVGSNINIGNNGLLKYWNGSAWIVISPGLPGQSLQFINGHPTWINNPQGITTTIVSSITFLTAISGGNILNDGGSRITARGICWSTSHNPTLVNNFTIDSSGIGSFTSNLTGITYGTAYYVRAYATNSTGTAYGNEISFTTLSIGNNYQGGIIAYFLQSGDPGYNANVPHGLIVYPNSYATNYASVSYFSGESVNGYNDWYVPSNNELYKLYLNRLAIGVFSNNYYWSSTSTGFFSQGYALNLITGDLQTFNQFAYNYFIVIRKF